MLFVSALAVHAATSDDMLMLTVAIFNLNRGDASRTAALNANETTR